MDKYISKDALVAETFKYIKSSMTVYVRWYGNIVQGELIDGESMGMKQVRIPLDGHHPIALFTSGHVYQTGAEAFAGHEEFDPAEVKNKKFEVKVDQISGNSPIISHNDPIKEFKLDNWDHERNHLRTDKLDEFYQLWRRVMVPPGYVEADTSVTLPSHKPVSPMPSKKMLRSAGQQQFADSTQLALFD